MYWFHSANSFKTSSQTATARAGLASRTIVIRQTFFRVCWPVLLFTSRADKTLVTMDDSLHLNAFMGFRGATGEWEGVSQLILTRVNAFLSKIRREGAVLCVC